MTEVDHYIRRTFCTESHCLIEQSSVLAVLSSSSPHRQMKTRFFQGDDPAKLVQEIFQAFIEVSDANYELERAKFKLEFDHLERAMQPEAAEGEGGDEMEKKKGGQRE